MNSIGSMILEELAERHQPLSALRDAIGSDDATLCEYLDGRRSVLPVARLLARFFGTSESLWKNMACQCDKRSGNGQETVNDTARELAEAQECDDPVGAILRLKAELAEANTEIARLNDTWDDAINYAAREKKRADATEGKQRLTLGDELGEVLATVRMYRAVQDEEHGGPAHDDTHTADDWKLFIEKFNQRARHATRTEDRERDLFHVAALAVAAIQSSRRISTAKCCACGMPDTVAREDGILRYCVHCGSVRYNTPGDRRKRNAEL